MSLSVATLQTVKKAEWKCFWFVTQLTGGMGNYFFGFEESQSLYHLRSMFGEVHRFRAVVS